MSTHNAVSHQIVGRELRQDGKRNESLLCPRLLRSRVELQAISSTHERCAHNIVKLDYRPCRFATAHCGTWSGTAECSNIHPDMAPRINQKIRLSPSVRTMKR